MFNSQFKMAVAFLMDMALQFQVFSNELNRNIQDKQVTLNPHVMYVTKDIAGAGAGATELVTSQTSEVYGISSVNENRLAKNAGFIFDKVRLGYATAAAGTNLATLNYGGISKAELANSILKVIQNGRTLFEIPVSHFGKPQNPETIQDEYFDLGGFQYLRDDEAFQIQIIVPDGTAISGADAATALQAVKIEFLGFETVRKNYN